MDANNPANFIVHSPASQKPSSSFRIIFMVLLLGVLVSAAATTYILVTGKKPNLVPTSPSLQTSLENPFASETESSNPFADTTSTEDTSNPFAGTETASTNPFDQFEAGSSATSPNASGYENPF